MIAKGENKGKGENVRICTDVFSKYDAYVFTPSEKGTDVFIFTDVFYGKDGTYCSLRHRGSSGLLPARFPRPLKFWRPTGHKNSAELSTGDERTALADCNFCLMTLSLDTTT